VTELQKGVEGPEMNITQAYIGEGYRGNGVQELTVQKFEKYAKERGCVFLTSMTRRGNPEAYIRWMGRVGFSKRAMVVEKDLREV
jgi:GNAT superfamily N-acetyltransferase